MKRSSVFSSRRADSSKAREYLYCFLAPRRRVSIHVATGGISTDRAYSLHNMIIKGEADTGGETATGPGSRRRTLACWSGHPVLPDTSTATRKSPPMEEDMPLQAGEMRLLWTVTTRKKSSFSALYRPVPVLICAISGACLLVFGLHGGAVGVPLPSCACHVQRWRS